MTFTTTPSPATGPRPFTVQFTDTSPVLGTAWRWDFQNDGTIDSTVQNPTWTYTTAGTYTVRLVVTYPTGPVTKIVPNLVFVTVGICTVPDFFGVMSDQAQALWDSRNFISTVTNPRREPAVADRLPESRQSGSRSRATRL